MVRIPGSKERDSESVASVNHGLSEEDIRLQPSDALAEAGFSSTNAGRDGVVKAEQWISIYALGLAAADVSTPVVVNDVSATVQIRGDLLRLCGGQAGMRAAAP